MLMLSCIQKEKSQELQPYRVFDPHILHAYDSIFVLLIVGVGRVM